MYVRFLCRRGFFGRVRAARLCALGAVFAGIFVCVSSKAETNLDANKTLMQAAKEGDLAAAEHALQEGADPNCRVEGTGLNFTPLLQAILESRLEISKLLLDHGADPHIEDENGDPAMVFAAKKENEGIARLLIARGVSVDSKNREGLTALIRQISSASLDDIQLMLELGADPNQRGNGGETPLIMLTEISSASPNDGREGAAMEVLIKHGADVNATDDLGSSALLHAVQNATRATVETLVRAGADVNQPNKEGVTPLMVALARKNEQGLIDFLLGHGADVKMRNAKGATTLMIALEAGQVEAAARLIKQGVDPKAMTTEGITAAHSAALFGGWGYDTAERAKDRRTAVALLRTISKAGGDLETTDEQGYAPLHYAVMSGHLAAVDFLLAHGSSPNRPNCKGETPLMLSLTSSMDGFAKMKLLREKRAAIDAQNAEGRTALMLAAQTMQKGALMYLLRQNADANLTDKSGATALSLLAANAKDRAVDARNYGSMIRALAVVTSSLDQSDAEGVTPLMWAAISDLPEAVTPLLEKDADIHARSRDGRTALMWAACADAERTVPLLLTYGNELVAKDKQGHTALEWAKMLGLPVAKTLEEEAHP